MLVSRGVHSLYDIDMSAAMSPFESTLEVQHYKNRVSWSTVSWMAVGVMDKQHLSIM